MIDEWWKCSISSATVVCVSILLIIILWEIWKHRMKATHKGIIFSSQCVIMQITRFFHNLSIARHFCLSLEVDVVLVLLDFLRYLLPRKQKFMVVAW